MIITTDTSPWRAEDSPSIVSQRKRGTAESHVSYSPWVKSINQKFVRLIVFLVTLQ